jgi:hypothetical protein
VLEALGQRVFQVLGQAQPVDKRGLAKKVNKSPWPTMVVSKPSINIEQVFPSIDHYRGLY